MGCDVSLPCPSRAQGSTSMAAKGAICSLGLGPAFPYGLWPDGMWPRNPTQAAPGGGVLPLPALPPLLKHPLAVPV